MYVINQFFLFFLLQQVNDYESWIYNLTEANQNPTRNPLWYKQYSFKEAFGLQDLSPSSLDALMYKFATNRELINQVNRFHFHFKLQLYRNSISFSIGNSKSKAEIHTWREDATTFA